MSIEVTNSIQETIKNLEAQDQTPEIVESIRALKEAFNKEVTESVSEFKAEDGEIQNIEQSVGLKNPELTKEIEGELKVQETLKNLDTEAEKLKNESLEQLETSADRAERKYETEIVPILQILKPDGMSFEDYEKQTMEGLFDDAKQRELAQGTLLADPEKTIEEVKSLLDSKVRAILTDSHDHKKEKNINPELVKKAKLVLLSEGDLTDVNVYSRDNPIDWDIRSFRDYVVGYGKDFRLTESDIDALMNTKYRENITYGDFSNYISNDYGSCDTIPKSLLVGFAQSQSNRNMYHLIESAFETAEEEKYDNECLEHLLASDDEKGYTNSSLKYFDKFQGKPIEKILKSGLQYDNGVVHSLLNLNLPKEDFNRYIDMFTKHTIGHQIREARGLFNNKNRETTELHCKDTLEKLSAIELDMDQYSMDKIDDTDLKLSHLNTIKEIIHEGGIGLALATSQCRKYIKKYSDLDYENFKKDISQFDQEHLVSEYLSDRDKVAYAEKLLEQNEAYQLVKLHKIFPKHGLDLDIYQQIKEKGFLPNLKGKLEAFKNLPPEEALEFIRTGKTDIFINNLDSFVLPEGFLSTPEVQEACLTEFKKKLLNSTYPENSRKIFDKIPFPKDIADQSILEAIKIKWVTEERNDWARSIIYTYPHIRSYLDNPEDIERALEDLRSSINTEYLYTIASILECFPLPKERINNNETSTSIINKVKTEIAKTKGRLGDDIYTILERKFSDMDRITKFVPLPDYFNKIRSAVNDIKNLPYEKIDIKEDIIQHVIKSETPDLVYQNILNLFNEIKNTTEITLDKNIALSYISRFENSGTPEEKKEFFEKIKKDILSLAKNIPANFSDKKEYYQYILKDVYPQRNYDTYVNIEKYEDRTSDLDKYVFNRNGYEMKLSGVVGYKLKDGLVSNDQIIDEYSKRIDVIKELATIEKLNEFLKNSIVEGVAVTTEGKILEYFKQKGYTADTMNILLAYQLFGQYDDFVAGSVDRVSQEESKVSKDYILLDELVNRYGDNMKETIKQIQEAVSVGEDKELFTGSVSEKYEERYNQLSDVIQKDLARVPRDKITDETVQKKILKTIKNTFQGSEHIQKRVVYFASLFSANDLDNFNDMWIKHYNELFAVESSSAIDTSKVEALQSSIYTKLQNEIGKYEEIKEVDDSKKKGVVEEKLTKERVIKAYFSKNKENAHARMVADVCLAGDANMLKNENYFELAFFDEEREKCVGTTMLLEMSEGEDGKYLLYCPNPSVGLVSEVSAKKLYKTITDQVIQFSKDNNFDGILVDKKHGSSTNRAGLFQQSLEQSCLKDVAGKEITIDLKKGHLLGGGYTYEKNLQVVWKK